MNFLLFDYDQSTASIGGYEGAKRLLGIEPVPVRGGVTGTFTGAGPSKQMIEAGARQLLRSVFTAQSVRESHPLLEGVFTERTEVVPTDKAQQMGLRGIIIDTASTMADQELTELGYRRVGGRDKGLEPRMERQDWGVFGSIMMRFWQTLSQFQTVSIVNSHVKRTRDDTGAFVETPDIGGQSGTGMYNFFDVVLFARIYRTKEKSEYLWQAAPDEKRPAKDRLNVLPDMMNQDFSKILFEYATQGVYWPNILVIGESGHGKTYALQTLHEGDKSAELVELYQSAYAEAA